VTAEVTLETVVLSNTPAPGGTAPFLGFGPVPFGFFRTALYQRLNGVNLLIAGEGDAVAAAGGALIREFDQFSLARATMNASGDVTFRVELDTTGPGGVTNDNRFFEPPAKGRTYHVEGFATDDGGTQQGWDTLGTLTVRKK
jgi:hypothetical protein